MSEPNEQVEAFARILAAIESRKPGWGFTLDDAVEYRTEKWRRHVYEAEQLLEEMEPWLSEHDRQVAERAWDEGYEAAAEFHEGREKGHWENDCPAKGMRTWRPDPAPTSPYRAAKGEQK